MVDIDGTICYNNNSKYEISEPDAERIKHFNELYEQGNEIHYWTARGANSGKDWEEFTIRQLNKWGVKYHSLRFGKPHYDIWIDDKAQNDKEYFKTIKNST
jgi:hypothetical protein